MFKYEINSKIKFSVYALFTICMVHTLIQIQSYLFIISQPIVSFQFLIF